jgi:hypothetical protein
MTRHAIRTPIIAFLTLAVLLAASAAKRDCGAGEAPKPADAQKEPPGREQDKPEKDVNEEHRRDAERVVATIDLEMLVGEKWVKVKRIEKPLLYYGDPTRSNDRGSVWGWGEKGRPVALLELFKGIKDRTTWSFTICNTSGGKVRATRDGEAWWRENASATELKDIPGAPAPAGEAAARQRQLKQLAGKFAGHEFWDPNNSRFELRRLDRPLHTYRDEDRGILDGALYTFANGTNPEIVLFVEARADTKEKPAWQFAVGRLAHAELHLEYDGKEVFDAPRGNRVAGPDRPYWINVIEGKSDR